MSIPLSRFRAAPVAAITIACLAATGCNLLHRSSSSVPLPSTAAAAATVRPPMAVDLTKVHPNEAGVVPILMYHDIVTSPHPHDLQYNADQFRKDLEYLYDHNYRPVSLTQFLSGRIDIAAGMSPVVLTFDDALPGQFRFLPNGQVDPNCAVGIMDAFHQTHPDWQTRGCFFVLTNEDPKLPPPFYQPQYAQGKLEYLVKEGYDVENHTVHHLHMNRLAPDRVQYEIAMAIPGIHQYLPNANVNILALPYGQWPKDQKLLVSGSCGGNSYHNIAVLRAAWRPAPSPIDKGFDPYKIERITPGVKFGQSYYWFKKLDADSGDKYVSDGDPSTITVSSFSIGQIDKARIAKLGLRLREYTGDKFD